MSKCKCGCGADTKPGRIYINGHNLPFLGKKHSQKSKDKMSKARENITITEETRKKLSVAGIGRTHSEESRLKQSIAKTKERHHFWKGGVMVYPNGRVFIRIGKQKYKARARIAMEEKLGRPLLSNEIIHHINGDPSDDRIENLMLTNRGDHITEHCTGIKASESTRKKIGDARRGRTHSEETRLRISKSLKEGRYGKNK